MQIQAHGCSPQKDSRNGRRRIVQIYFGVSDKVC